MTMKIGASSTKHRWNDIDWRFIRCSVNRLQMCIANATKHRRFGKVKALQRLLTRSYSAKILAVKKVTSSKGSNTAGIDGKLYKTGVAKMKLALSLKARGYKASPMRRIYIPKKGSKRKLRPISIPTMYDRSMQWLYCLALEPVAEMSADPNSYGFRAQRCTADAIEQVFVVLCQKLSGKWILECDIEDCFNKISHQLDFCKTSPNNDPRECFYVLVTIKSQFGTGYARGLMKRHIKIRGEARVHDPDSLKYLAQRKLDKIRRRKEPQQEAESKTSILVDTTLAACLLPGF